MARGTANNEPVVSQANTDEYRREHERIFGSKEPERGTWVQDPVTGELIPSEKYVPPTKAVHAPIMVDRFYENMTVHDGTKIRDIGSRSKHRAYMREHGLTTVDDYKGVWEQKRKEVEARRAGKMPSKTRRDVIGRALYNLWKP